MTISLQPYERFAGAPSLSGAFALIDNTLHAASAQTRDSLKSLFDRFGLADARTFRAQADENISSTQGTDEAEIMAPSLDPTNISLKTRIKNLISSFNPDAALYKMQTLAEQNPETFTAIAQDIHADLQAYGYDFHAKTLARIDVSNNPEPSVANPANDHNNIWTPRLVM